jgi:hypothetical protein
VRVDLREPLSESERSQVSGRLTAVEYGVLTLDRAKGGAVTVPLAQIVQGRLEVEWKRPQPVDGRGNA